MKNLAYVTQLHLQWILGTIKEIWNLEIVTSPWTCRDLGRDWRLSQETQGPSMGRAEAGPASRSSALRELPEKSGIQLNMARSLCSLPC